MCSSCGVKIDRRNKSGLCRRCHNRSRAGKRRAAAVGVASAPPIDAGDDVWRWLWAQTTRDIENAGPRDRAALVKSAESLYDKWCAAHPPPPERNALDEVHDRLDAIDKKHAEQ